MRTLAELTKRQRDKAFRQQSQSTSKNLIISTPDNQGGGGEVSNPAADLSAHKTSGDHDSRYARVFINLTDVPETYTGQAGKTLLVNTTEDGLEFGVASGGSGAFDFGTITDATTTSQDWGTLA